MHDIYSQTCDLQVWGKVARAKPAVGDYVSCVVTYAEKQLLLHYKSALLIAG